MKTRIHISGGRYGDRDSPVWSGDIPLINSAPGMRFAVVDDESDSVRVFLFRQVCLEIHSGGDLEQVVYVSEMKTDKDSLLLG